MTTGLKIAIGIGAFLVIVGLVFLVLCLTKVINCGGGGSPVSGSYNSQVGDAPAKSVGSAPSPSDCFGLKSPGSVPPSIFGKGNEFCRGLESDGKRDNCDKAIALSRKKWYRCKSKSCNGSDAECNAKDHGGRTGWYVCSGPKEGVKACKDTPVCSNKNCNAKEFCAAAADCCLDYNASDCAKCVVGKCKNS